MIINFPPPQRKKIIYVPYNSLNRRSNLVNYARLGTLTLSPLMRHSAVLQFFPRGNKWSETGPICTDREVQQFSHVFSRHKLAMINEQGNEWMHIGVHSCRVFANTFVFFS